ncbi:MAG: tetratricopeptide repeat protein [Saprospiraceae bacterium]|jgi:Ca-activated chloride channel family protein|nr:tetratricopeptide repeat protein [Saprospiraceae bacterium]
MKNFYLITIFLFTLSAETYAQSAHKNLRNGDMLYGFGKYAEAETEYRKAETQKPSLKSTYNLGNTLMNQERYEEAIKKYEDAASKANTSQEKASVYHNLGNALYKKQQYKESVDAYKKSLRYQPDDNETKENLALARRELKKQQNQQQKDKNNQDQKNDQKDQKDQQNQNDQQNNKEDNQDQNSQNQNQQNQQDQNKNKEQQQAQSDNKMSKQDAQKLLEIMDSEEKKVQQKLRRIDGKPTKGKKDW